VIRVRQQRTGQQKRIFNHKERIETKRKLFFVTFALLPVNALISHSDCWISDLGAAVRFGFRASDFESVASWRDGKGLQR
jgi:hypothetical protein